MKKGLVMLMLLLAYVAVLVPFTSFMRSKPFAEKLGFIPQENVLKLFSADQKQFIAALLTMKTSMYYGGLAQQAERNIPVEPEYFGIYKALRAAVKLDPYNADPYYFGQAVLAWDIRRIFETNELLEYGMKHRYWDFYLPYFAGFNYAYFLKDYANAARYYQRVGELTGDPMIVKLAGRYMYEAGRTDMAIAYLKVMGNSTNNEAIKNTFRLRLKALQEAKRIEAAVNLYQQAFKRAAKSVDELLRTGYLKEKPVDPYGGVFYLDKNGRVRTTSKFVSSKRGGGQ